MGSRRSPRGLSGPARDVVKHEVVEAGVEASGDAGEHVATKRDPRVLVAADLAGVGPSSFGGLAMGPAGFGAEFFEAVAEGHGVVFRAGVSWPRVSEPTYGRRIPEFIPESRRHWPTLAG